MRAVVVHSPLVGPATTRPLAAALTSARWSVSAPDLRSGATSPAAYAHLAIETAGSADVVIADSGAGVVLPVIADALDALAVYLDAVVPDAADSHEPSVSFVELIDGLPIDEGLLPPWHEWWPESTMQRLVPDPDLRAAIMAETPRLPRSFYDHVTALPAQWWTRPAAYVQLSPAYDDDRTRAESFGWPVATFAGQHLDLATRPADVAAVVRALVASVR